jgi:hypothetical protein
MEANIFVFFFNVILKHAICPGKSLAGPKSIQMRIRAKPVLPRGRNFGRKTQKGPEKIVWGRENLGPKFWQIYQKRAEKGPSFFGV